MERPKDLPDYGAPPLSEVVLGVQFEPVGGYQQIYAGAIWELFKANFPHVEEHPSLPPSFEIFGSNIPSGPSIQLTTGASHDRFWFVSKDKHLLVQFQQDRFVQNWRRVKGEAVDYPRFENMLESYEENLRKLNRYFEATFGSSLKINQCEISYMNHIRFSPEVGTTPQEWINFIKFPTDSKIDFRCDYRKKISNEIGEPVGRLIVGARLNAEGEEILSYDLSVKGVPTAPNIESALEFLITGRHLIVTTFTETTSEKAHRAWKRIQ